MKFKKENWHSLNWQTAFSGEEIEIEDITSDSRQAKEKSAFFSFDGTVHKGKDFVFEALEKKTAAVFVDSKYRDEVENHENFAKELPVFFASDFSDTSAKTISFLSGDPAEAMSLIAVTGTNGKTTITQAIYSVINMMNEKAACIGTLGMYFHDEVLPSNLTTPGIIELYKTLKKAKEKEAKYTAMEVSSHGLSQGRVKNLSWSAGVFTNLTPDHLDYHQTMENYFESKKELFQIMLENSAKAKGAVICVNDEYGMRMANWLKEKNPPFSVILLGKDGDASLENITPSWEGYSVDLRFEGQVYNLKTLMTGIFNLYNMSSVFLTLKLLGFNENTVLEKIALVQPPPGRMEIIHAKGGRKIVIDYSHTPDALENALKTLRELGPRKIITVFGCGGNRDKEKRPIMAEAASRLSDFVIITNDNPREEDPKEIVNDILKGDIRAEHDIIYDRKEAIAMGIKKLGRNDCLLIAGKGHENYQIIGKEKRHFDDKETAEELLKKIILV
ncbi:MAG: UDP-N-acetylmuramoyl-L-alanyl-D-glutamate--2,6-diaminopimelate ligase [Spirochaetia bacterium]|nr:UDP-N-acetylmuramoyl-L-alanyl-D-glutamate--2,6-diaminopimelate ligase [Spirochaetia bacterium]